MDVIVSLADPALAPKLPNVTTTGGNGTLSWLAVKDIVQIKKYFELEFKVCAADALLGACRPLLSYCRAPRCQYWLWALALKEGKC